MKSRLSASVPAAAAPSGRLDPHDWAGFRTFAHHLLDRILDHLQGATEGPVWRPFPASRSPLIGVPLPRAGAAPEAVLDQLATELLPYGVGNLHPRFFGWVHGAGTPGGVLAEMLAAALNANCGGRDHGAIYLERQVIAWMRELMGFSETASGLLVSGTSMANLIALQVARSAALGVQVRHGGVAADAAAAGALVGYASSAVHTCVPKALEIAGLGRDKLQLLPVDENHRLAPALVREAIARDRAAGRRPFLLVANAGTVDVGAIDDLEALGAIARENRLWFHVDGAFGAWAVLSPEHAGRLRGLGQADSLAFDFHKWAHVPYDAGCVLVRDETLHRETFATEPSYLTRAERGAAAGAPWFCDYGPELSRGARAIKVWTTLREQGLDRIGASIAANCAAAGHLAALIRRTPPFELLAPAPLNIVCFRHHPAGLGEAELDRHNHLLAVELQESGEALVSTTRIGGKLALRACIMNHRSTQADVERLLESLAALAERRQAAGPAAQP